MAICFCGVCSSCVKHAATCEAALAGDQKAEDLLVEAMWEQMAFGRLDALGTVERNCMIDQGCLR